ncbi:MAG: alpha/beta fold hydrolase [Isosphaeraceae bacterium]
MTLPVNSLSIPPLNDTVPDFVPHPFVRNGHLQTIVGRYLVGPRVELPSVYHEIDVDGGDRLAALESIPRDWRAGDPLALLVHGLAGCARSPYVVRVAARLQARGVRVVRMNLRGAGSGFGIARGIYHAGKTDDLRRVVEWMARRAPGSPVALVGFSLGANLVLKLAAEASRHPLDGLDCVLAANPPIDLFASCQAVQKRENRIYDRTFVRQLRKDVQALHALFPELGTVPLPKVLTLGEFDDIYTAPRNGFDGAADYYAQSSVAPLIPAIEVAGLVVHSEDDPFIPVEPFRRVSFPLQLALELISCGGHLGYISRTKWMGDRRWLDGRLTTWLTARWHLN